MPQLLHAEDKVVSDFAQFPGTMKKTNMGSGEMAPGLRELRALQRT